MFVIIHTHAKENLCKGKNWIWVVHIYSQQKWVFRSSFFISSKPCDSNCGTEKINIKFLSTLMTQAYAEQTIQYCITYTHIVDMRMPSLRFGFIYSIMWTQFSSTDAEIVHVYICAQTERMSLCLWTLHSVCAYWAYHYKKMHMMTTIRQRLCRSPLLIIVSR